MHNRSIGCLYRQNRKRHGHCAILKMSINRASTIFGVASWVIYTLIRGNDWYIMYSCPFQGKWCGISFLCHHDNERQRSIHNFQCFNLRNSNVMWLWSGIINVMAAFIYKKVSDRVITQFRKWASTKRQWFLALHLGLYKWRLVADIYKRGISRIYWQKQQPHAPCPVLKIKLNGASTNFGLACLVIQVSHCNNNAYTM